MAFVRGFGLHQGNLTPCGQPLTVSEAHALTEIAMHRGLTQNNLAARLRLEKSTVSRLIKSLLERGWIERTPHDQDGRALRLSLTTAGHRVADRVAEARRHKFERLLHALPESERPTVLAALNTLVEALHDTEPQPV